jgi:hypothetical protein
VRPSNYPLADGETAVELTIAPELYQEAFAADLSEDVTRVLAVSQRPFAAIFEGRQALSMERAGTLPWTTDVLTGHKRIDEARRAHLFDPASDSDRSMCHEGSMTSRACSRSVGRTSRRGAGLPILG